AGASLPGSRIRATLVARDGTLWIGTDAGLSSWNGTTLHTDAQFDGTLVNALVQDREGTLWVGGARGTTGILCSVRNSAADCSGAEGSFGFSVVCLYEDKKGALWVAGSKGVWRWRPGPPKQYPLPDPITGIQCLSETASGNVLVAARNGARQL